MPRWLARATACWRWWVPLAFSLVRGRFIGRVLLDRIALAPVVVPTIILSVSVYGLFAKLKLVGAWYGLVVAHTVLALPFVVLVMVAGLRDFDRGLEQAATTRRRICRCESRKCPRACWAR